MSKSFASGNNDIINFSLYCTVLSFYVMIAVGLIGNCGFLMALTILIKLLLSKHDFLAADKPCTAFAACCQLICKTLIFGNWIEIKKIKKAFLSFFQTHKHPGRGTILDTRQSVDVANLVRNTEIVAQALARHIYNLTGGTFPFSKHMVRKHIWIYWACLIMLLK